MGAVLHAQGFAVLVTAVAIGMGCGRFEPAQRAREPAPTKPVASSAPVASASSTPQPGRSASSTIGAESLTDRDRDGILDKDDRCPTEPGARSPVRERFGCPSKLPIDMGGIMLNMVSFRPGSAKLDTSRELMMLDGIAERIREHSDHCLLIVGYADAQSDPPPLASLRLKRARAVERYLLDKKVKRERLAVDGAEDPCTTEPRNHDGRRVSMRVFRCPIPTPLPKLECRHKHSFYPDELPEESLP